MPSPGAAEFQKQASELEELRRSSTMPTSISEAVHKAEEAARARAALYRDVAQKLHKMVDTGR